MTFSLTIELNNNSMVRCLDDTVQDILNQAAAFNNENNLKVGAGKEKEACGVIVEVQLDPLNPINSFPILA